MSYNNYEKVNVSDDFKLFNFLWELSGSNFLIVHNLILYEI